ncbi:hypothetical protein PISMIDRAFT_675749 [Pisolithus microcarpus 441]|uniref:Uncharacterized protein n=1 Tax=Pisolithus microcarpus 441 TaxID=765257 RepID=A0A0D0A415_9AGAM|nr:hypothetical protein PISMIDRAFT_675749 [Pisolithus microcarpus 441]
MTKVIDQRNRRSFTARISYSDYSDRGLYSNRTVQDPSPYTYSRMRKRGTSPFAKTF